jgi:hypothetical protein
MRNFFIAVPAIVGPFPLAPSGFVHRTVAAAGLYRPDLFALRPFFDADLRSIRAPPGGA